MGLQSRNRAEKKINRNIVQNRNQFLEVDPEVDRNRRWEIEKQAKTENAINLSRVQKNHERRRKRSDRQVLKNDERRKTKRQKLRNEKRQKRKLKKLVELNHLLSYLRKEK